MPIYEYRCGACGRKASIFFRSIAAVEPDPSCPNCGERRLERRISRVWSRRSSSDDAMPQPAYEEDGVPFYGADPYDGGPDDEGYGDGPWDNQSGAEDAAAMAREAREMARMMGEPLDAEFDEALRHVEGGADPDDVFGELDAVESGREPPATGSDP